MQELNLKEKLVEWVKERYDEEKALIIEGKIYASYNVLSNYNIGVNDGFSYAISTLEDRTKDDPTSQLRKKICMEELIKQEAESAEHTERNTVASGCYSRGYNHGVFLALITRLISYSKLEESVVMETLAEHKND